MAMARVVLGNGLALISQGAGPRGNQPEWTALAELCSKRQAGNVLVLARAEAY